MRGTFYDYYNLIVRGNWGFSSSMSKGMLFNGYVSELNKKEATKKVEKVAYNDSVISMNKTFVEFVDPANRMRGLSSFFGIIGLIPMLIGMGYLIYFTYIDFHQISNFFIFFNSAIILIFLLVIFPISNMVIRWDMFRKTHYPMRFNRKNRKVYVFSQDMGVVCMYWDDIHFFISQSTSAEDSRGLARDEVRGYTEDESGNIEYHLNFFKYQGGKNLEGVLEIWELVRRFMESPDGPAQAYKVDQRLLALEGRRESFIHSLTQATRFMADSRFLQSVFALMVVWVGTGRILTKWTCRVPRWPEWVDQECKIEPSDPYIRNRSTEPPLSAGEVCWPLFCYLLGWAEILGPAYYFYQL